LICLLSVSPQAAQAQSDVEIAAGYAPPPLPLYDQPPLPGPDYLWSPGYWGWDEDAQDYYWVPGAWVLAPEPGYLWTPSWWGWNDGLYIFHAGYWGPHVGYYGGVAYGYGYTGDGFVGGYWNGGHYVYNQSVNHLSPGLAVAAYRGPAPSLTSRTSFSGGPGGVFARPTAENSAAAREAHIPATPLQTNLVRSAVSNPSFFARANHGAPPAAALSARGAAAGRSYGGAQIAPPSGGPPSGGALPQYRSRDPYPMNGAPSYAPRSPSPQMGAGYVSPPTRAPSYGGGGAPAAYANAPPRYAPPPPQQGPQHAAPIREAQRPPAPAPAAERRNPSGRGPDPHER
jgi:hypothetical protein